VFNTAYEQFCQQVDAEEETLLDPYGAEHPAEFFAVASEAFFEVPAALAGELPGVYGQLRDFYGVDPAIGERRMYQNQEGASVSTRHAGSGSGNTA
jgi:Mlc titration factor MtfA (ptsG expression regulator)